MKRAGIAALSFLFSSLLYSQDFRQTVAVLDFDASNISAAEVRILADSDVKPIQIKGFREGVIDAN